MSEWLLTLSSLVDGYVFVLVNNIDVEHRSYVFKFGDDAKEFFDLDKLCK